MNGPHESRRIFWMVRLLATVGLTTIIALLGLVGRQISATRTERLKLHTAQDGLYQTSEDILHRASAARGEIIAILDDNHLPGTTGAAAGLKVMVDRLVGSATHPFATEALAQLDTLTDDLAVVEERAIGWRAQYDPIWQDVGQQQTLGHARDLVTSLREALQTLEGRQRLHQAIEFTRWRAARGEEAARLAQTIVREQDQRRDQGDALERNLAEIESLVELLGGEEQADNLPNLKENKLAPVLDRLSQDLARFRGSTPDEGALVTPAVERLTVALFGQGYTKDPAHQTIRLGTGGLYALRRDILLLRKVREELRDERSRLSHEIDVMVAAFMQSARAQSELLAERAEQDLAANWRRMTLAGVGCSAFFVWLAWLIFRAIRRQVGVIERAKAQAEDGRREAQLLTAELHTRNEELSRSGREMQAANVRLTQEIEARKAVEAALARNREQEQELFVASREALMTLFPPDWRFTSANAATIKLFGAKDEADFLTRGPSAVSPEQQPDGELSARKAERMIATAMANGSHFFEWTHRRATGEVFPATVTLTRVEAHGTFGLQVVVRDATAQKRAEEALRESEDRLRQIIEHATQVFYAHDADGQLTYISPQAEEFFDCSPAEALQPWTAFLTDNPSNAEGIELTRRAIETGEPQPPYPLELKTKLGRTVWVEVRESPVVVQGRTVSIVGALTDITARRQAEGRLLAEKARLARQRDALIAFTSGGSDGEDLIGAIRRLTETDARTMGVARVSVWRYNDDRSAIRCVDLYELETDRHSAGVELPATAYPAYFRALAELDVISADDANRDPRTCEFSENYLRPLGITSMLDAPIQLAGAGAGVLCHEHIGPRRQWTPDEETFAVAVANRASLVLEGAERQRAEEELHWKTALLEAQVDSSLDGILVVDDEDHQVLKNQRFNEVWKIPREVAESEDDRKCLAFARTQAKNSTEFFEKVSHLRTHRDEVSRDEIELIDGTFLDRYTAPVQDKAGRHYGRIWTFRDVTERKRAEVALRESNRFIESIANNSTNFIYIFDLENGRNVYANRSVRVFLGYSQAQILDLGDRFLPTITHPEDLPRLVQHYAHFGGVPDSRILEIEYRVKHADGDWRWIWARDNVFERRPDGAAWQVIGTAQDITGRKQAEAALEKAHRELVDVSRQAGMSEIATSVLHNVGNVLNSVNVSADLLREQVRKTPVADLGRVVALLQEQRGNLGAFFAEDPRGPKLPEFLARLAEHFTCLRQTQLDEVTSLQKNVEHIKEIVAMQQSYARVSGVSESLQVTDLVEDALRMNGGSFQRHAVEVVRDFPPGLPAVITEKHKVLQILVNLLSNAKYACDGATAGEKRITVRVAHADDRLRVEVIDTGVGIAAEHLDRIFNLGFTTKKNGHGFGLHSAANAAKELGGSLTMHSAGPGQGATFTLELPVGRGFPSAP